MKKSVLDGYAMGAEGCDGLSIGLKVATRAKAGSKLKYELAIAYRGAEPKTLVLFNDTEGAYRTRVLISAAGKKPIVRALVVPKAFTQGGVKLAVDLAPKSVQLSDGFVTLPRGFTGALSLVPVLGGTPAMACEVRGKAVTVTAE